MKYSKNNLFIVAISFGLFLLSCGDSETTTTDGDELRGADSTLPNAADNNYPNNRIHMQDSSGKTDTSTTTDSTKK